MRDKELQDKILNFLNLRRRAGILRENRVAHLPDMLGMSIEEFERHVEFLNEQQLIHAMAAPSFDGRMNYFLIELSEKILEQTPTSEEKSKGKSGISI